MNYRHSYHAGNFADVFKHILLLSLIQHLLKKEKPFFYLDTHAGLADYDLLAEPAQKTQEYIFGIGKLWQQFDMQSSDLITDYLNTVRCWNKQRHHTTELRYYPGSPAFAKLWLRSFDRLLLTELHPLDILQLKKVFHEDSQVAIHHLDGFLALKAFLPPKENRGLVLIDPPFEQPDELKRLMAAVNVVNQRWPNGIYAIWYPIKEKKLIHDFYDELSLRSACETVCFEINLPVIQEGLSACGMVVINPPWQWQEKIELMLPQLCYRLSMSQTGSWRVKHLVKRTS